MPDQKEQIVNLALDAIRPSPFNPRKHLGDLLELAESIKQVGVLEPCVVRADNDDYARPSYEIVFGHRRHAAAKLADLEALPCVVREYTDDQVIEIQIIENGQRADVHPLDEADGYAVLIERGRTVAQIAEKIGRARAYVAKRLELVNLAPAARKALDDEEITIGVAVMLARIPSAKLQAEALEAVEPHSSGDTITAKAAGELIRERFMLQLASAPFDRASVDLVKKAGACTVCPKRTGNQAELFSDVKSADVCTDPTCYRAKVEAHGKLLLQDAKKSGRPVLPEKQAKGVFQEHSDRLTYNAKWSDLDGEEFSGSRFVKVRKLLGAKAEGATLAINPHTGKVHELVPKATVTRAIAAANKTKADQKRVGVPQHKTKLTPAEKAKVEAAALKAKAIPIVADKCIAAAVNAIVVGGAGDERVALELVLDQVLQDQSAAERVLRRRGVPLAKRNPAELGDAVRALFKGSDHRSLIAVLADLVLTAEADLWNSIDDPKLRGAFKALGVDTKRIERDVLAELKAAAKAPPAKDPSKDKGAKLAHARAARKGKSPTPGACRECGCTEEAACDTDDGPCYWADEAMTVCSACVDEAAE